MAVIPINIPDPIAPRVLNALSAKWGWTPASGQTKLQFVTATIAAQLKAAVKDYEAETDAKAAYDSAKAKAESEITIT